MSENQPLEIENKTIEYDSITYTINEEENTASVTGCFFYTHINKVIIPRSITYESKEYLVVSISENAFKNSLLEYIEFSPDSELRRIEKYAFSDTSIYSITLPPSVTFIGEYCFHACLYLRIVEIPKNSKLKTIDKCAFHRSGINRITIPSELIELKEGWCDEMENVKKIEVSPENPRYRCYEDKMIIGKTNIDQENYDCLVFCVRDQKPIKIPNFIERICSNSCDYCYSIEIPDDSKLKTIDKDAFSYSKIKSIKIPAGLIDLKDGWCFDAYYINKIEVSPENPRYRCYEDKMIIGKTNIDQDNYDCLVFCFRDIKQVKIPNFIEHICPYLFGSCNSIEFPDDSKLRAIDKKTFGLSFIKSIRIPSSVTYIGEHAFDGCHELEIIEIPDDSKLKTIEKNAFSYSKIKSIKIPAGLIDLKDGWCFDAYYINKIEVSPENPRYRCYEDKMIIGKTNIDQDNYDCLVFCFRDIKHVKIPNFIEHICSYSFDMCHQLESIEIPDDSKLKTINNKAFSQSIIKKIKIPSSVIYIGEYAFNCCQQLEDVEIQNDSNLQFIDHHSFINTAVERIKIPSTVTNIGEYAFNSCEQLKLVEIPNDSNLQVFGKFSFSCTSIKSIKIPSSVTHIGEFAFHGCAQLKVIEIPNDSKIQVFDKGVFAFTAIKRIMIPSSVKLIKSNALKSCKQLSTIEIQNDSKLQAIDNFAFFDSAIISISLPSSVSYIGESAFSLCHKLLIIEINNSELKHMLQDAFKLCEKTLLIMVAVHS